DEASCGASCYLASRDSYLAGTFLRISIPGHSMPLGWSTLGALPFSWERDSRCGSHNIFFLIASERVIAIWGQPTSAPTGRGAGTTPSESASISAPEDGRKSRVAHG